MPLVIEDLRRRTAEQLIELATTAGLPWAPITRPEDLLHDRTCAGPAASRRRRLPDGRETLAPLLPLAWDGDRLPKRLDPPNIGEHTVEILRGAGLAPAEIDELVARGVAASSPAPAFPHR